MHAEPTGEDTSSDAYTLDVSEHEGTRVLSATGEIDIISAPALRAALLPALEAAESVVLDMSGVNFLGSSGLAVLVEARDQAQRSSGDLRLVCSSRIVLRALEATGLRELFEISPDLATALQR